MPEIFRMYGMRFFFYTNEHLPVHVHVSNQDETAKFEINPVQLLKYKGMKTSDLAIAESIIEERKDEIIQNWNEIFGV